MSKEEFDDLCFYIDTYYRLVWAEKNTFTNLILVLIFSPLLTNSLLSAQLTSCSLVKQYVGVIPPDTAWLVLSHHQECSINEHSCLIHSGSLMLNEISKLFRQLCSWPSLGAKGGLVLRQYKNLFKNLHINVLAFAVIQKPVHQRFSICRYTEPVHQRFSICRYTETCTSTF